MKNDNQGKKASILNYNDIKVGDTYNFFRTIIEANVNNFAKLLGDFNPLHTDKEYGKNSKFRKNIAHGMLAGSLFSTLIGMHCPGEKSLYISQSLYFKKPIFFGDNLEVRGTVVDKSDSIKIITIKTEIFRGEELAVSGEAKVTLVE